MELSSPDEDRSSSQGYQVIAGGMPPGTETGGDFFVPSLLPIKHVAHLSYQRPMEGGSDAASGDADRRSTRASFYRPEHDETLGLPQRHDALYARRHEAWDNLESPQGYATGPVALETAVEHSTGIHPSLTVDRAIELRLGALQTVSAEVHAGVPTILAVSEAYDYTLRPHYVAGVPEHNGLSVGARTVHDPSQRQEGRNSPLHFCVGINGQTEINAADTVFLYFDEPDAPRAIPTIQVISGETVGPYLQNVIARSVYELAVPSDEGDSTAYSLLAAETAVRAHMLDALLIAEQLGIGLDEQRQFTSDLHLHTFVGDAVLDVACGRGEHEARLESSIKLLNRLWPQESEEKPADYIIQQSHLWRTRYPANYSRAGIVQLLTDWYGMDLLDVLDKVA